MSNQSHCTVLENIADSDIKQEIKLTLKAGDFSSDVQSLCAIFSAEFVS